MKKSLMAMITAAVLVAGLAFGTVVFAADQQNQANGQQSNCPRGCCTNCVQK